MILLTSQKNINVLINYVFAINIGQHFRLGVPRKEKGHVLADISTNYLFIR
jgi:hypothetical protein